jgi:hypothetical protein
MVLMVAFAWPQLHLLLAVGAMNFLFVSLLAILAQLPWLHVAAMGCLSIAYLSGFHLWQGTDVRAPAPGAQLVRAVVSGASAAALAVFATAVAVAGGALSRRWGEVSRHYLTAAGGLGLLCVVIGLYAGFLAPDDAHADLATPVLVYGSLAALTAAWYARRQDLAWLGTGILFMACLHALSANHWLQGRLAALTWWPNQPYLHSFLVHSVLASLLSLAAFVRFRAVAGDAVGGGKAVAVMPQGDDFAAPLAWSAIASSLIAALMTLPVLDERYGTHACYFAAASLAWLVLALVRSPAAGMAVFQVITTLSVGYATAAACVQPKLAWDGLLEPASIYTQLWVLAVLCGGWALVRRQGEKLPWLQRCWPADIETSFDQTLLGVLVGAITGLSLWACVPGILMELGTPWANASELGMSPGQGTWHGREAWWGVAAVLLALAVNLWRHGSVIAMTGMVATTAAVPHLIAAHFGNQTAVSSALRWSIAVWGLVWCLPACLVGGRKGQPPLWLEGGLVGTAAGVIRTLSSSYTIFMVVTLTTAAVLSVAAGYVPGGPVVGSFFHRVGSSVSFATPLLMGVVVLSAYALREQKPSYALAASLLFQYAVSLACLLPVFTSGAAFDAVSMAKLWQANFAGLAVFTACWVAAWHWITREPMARARRSSIIDPLAWQIGMFVTVQLIGAGWIASLLFLDPARNWSALDVLGQWPNYGAWLVGWLAVAWLAWRAPSRDLTGVVCVALIVLVHLAAASLHLGDGSGRWWGHHTLAAGRVALAAGIVAWLAALVSRRVVLDHDGGPRARRAAVLWACVVIGLAALAALRSGPADPWRPAWPTGVMASAAVLTGVLGVCLRRQGFAYVTILAAGAAGLLLWSGLGRGHPLGQEWGFIGLIVLAVQLAALAWLAMEIFFQHRGESGLDPRRAIPPVHHALGFAVLMFCLLHAGLSAAAFTVGGRLPRWNSAELAVAGCAWFSVMASMVGSWWDRRAIYGTAGLYAACASVAAFVVGQLQLTPSWRLTAMLAALATQVALSGWIWSWGSKLAAIGLRLGITDPVAGLRRTDRWLPPVTLVLSCGVGILSVFVVLASEARPMRVTAACLPILLGMGCAGMAQLQRRDSWQMLSLLFLGLAGVLLGLADIEPQWTERLVLLRAMRVLMSLCATSFVLGVIAARVLSSESGWRQSARRAAVLAGSLAGGALLCVLIIEAATFQPRIGAPVETLHIVAVSVLLAALVVALLSLAVLPDRDPLHLSEKGRMGYVYAAQIVAGMLFAHIYLARPTLFSGVLQPWWPYIVLVIAFGGVAVGEVFQRMGWRVLAEPFERSGAFLPLVPVIGMWLVNSNSDYSVLLFAVGVLYLLISLSQKSVVAGAAAALAGNGSLWSLLSGTEDLTFARHPQFWLIPPAVSVLLAAQLNRQRLTAAQLASIRYVAVSMIYVSSAVEMLRLGIGQSLWPPVILIALAIAGVFLGIALQVRAFLYLGSIFVVVGMFSMVAHAARSIQHVWPWWAFGIAMGTMILVVFGWFESRRTQMRALVERLRKWEK